MPPYFRAPLAGPGIARGTATNIARGMDPGAAARAGAANIQRGMMPRVGVPMGGRLMGNPVPAAPSAASPMAFRGAPPMAAPVSPAVNTAGATLGGGNPQPRRPW